MPLPNLRIADICKFGKGIIIISMKIADFFRENVRLRE
jgi:hypothetical protein